MAQNSLSIPSPKTLIPRQIKLAITASKSNPESYPLPISNNSSSSSETYIFPSKNPLNIPIPINNMPKYKPNCISKSWGNIDNKAINTSFPQKTNNNRRNCRNSSSRSRENSPIQSYKHSRSYEESSYVNGLNRSPGKSNSYDESSNRQSPYNAILNCKSAGIIPYTIYNGVIYFMFQKMLNPVKKRDEGLNDFGGKKIGANETTAEIAAREFSEETSCLFYLKSVDDDFSKKMYNVLKHNDELYYDAEAVNNLIALIDKSKLYYSELITQNMVPLYTSSKEIYISYFIKVVYVPEEDLPNAEDIHIPYEYRYIRTCKWYTINEIMAFDEKDFHKRLQITKIQQRIQNLYSKNMFV